MFRAYEEIFEQRGRQYHRAMRSHPQVRRAEFEALLEIAKLEANLEIADIPSGGGYLQNFLPTPTHLIQIETCEAFSQVGFNEKETDAHTATQASTTVLLCKSLQRIPLATGHLDRILSLAGLHHIQDRTLVYREFHRLLKHQGLCCIGEVSKQSGVAHFLNEFVDRHSHLGHQGLFFDDNEVQLMKQIGFQILSDRLVSYPWQFPSQVDMVQFCRDLFGIDCATDDELFIGIQRYLNHQVKGDRHQFQWQLRFIQAQK